MLMELAGMSMAAVNGDSMPCTAKNNPMKLYKSEIIKVITIIRLLFLQVLMKRGNCVS